MKPRALILYPQVAWPAETGSLQRVEAVRKWLAQQMSVSLVTPSFAIHPDRVGQPPYEHVFAHIGSIRQTKTPALVRKFKGRMGYYWARNAGLNEKCSRDTRIDEVFRYRRVLRQLRPSLVFCEYVSQLPNLYVARGKLPISIVLDTHDIIWRRQQHEVELGLIAKAGITQAEEAYLWSLADLVVGIQPEEAAEIASLLPGKPVISVPQAYEPRFVNPARKEAHRLLFVGSKARPNVNALEAFLQTTWPALKARHPHLQLDVCGTVCGTLEAGLLASEGVAFHGRVEDLEPFYARAALVINPMLYGSGLKIKNVEALSYGKALLTSPVGAQGMDLPSGIAAVEPKHFGGKISEIMLSPETLARWEKDCRNFFLATYTPEACFAPLAQWLQQQSL